jgi:hypothetical protein
MTVDISRRQLIAVLGGAAVCPPAARAQQSGKLVTIGLLGSSTPSTTSKMVAAFVQRLRERGWIEGSNLAIAYRWAEGRTEHLSEIAAELVRLKVDAIVTIGSSAARAAKQATSVIPIIFALVGDPVGIDLVASLARPGGNITGFSNQAIDLGAKKLDFLHDVVPGLRRLAIIFNVGNPGNMLEMAQVQTAAHKLGVEVIKLEIRRPEDIEAAGYRNSISVPWGVRSLIKLTARTVAAGRSAFTAFLRRHWSLRRPVVALLITVLSDAEAAETAAEFIALYTPHVAIDSDAISLPIGTQLSVVLGCGRCCDRSRSRSRP